ncbi:MAG: alkaline phosphatase family protein [Verrucomicrobiales bacterium]|nr:alkaline phosphatase family protein [Verrucomicrobiales bacterium]
MSLSPTVIINVVGLTPSLIGEHTPHIADFLSRRENRIGHIEPVLPAVTCSAQATYLTGKLPAEHGIVGNGWYDRAYAEHRFWKQSNRLVEAPKLWDLLRENDPDYSCANLFWWFNMYSSVDYSITPRPIYKADGSKVFGVASQPESLAKEVCDEVGDFPFHTFWGPMANIESSRWIAQVAKTVELKHDPGLTLIYLPHLDYNLQRIGPNDPYIFDDLCLIDAVVGDLIRFYEAREVKVVLLSEYGITEVDRPIHLNRIFREKGWLAIKNELNRDTLDLGASQAFAIADHQVAHVYVNNPDILEEVRGVLTTTAGVDEVIGPSMKNYYGLEHENSGDLIAVSDARSWFTYYFWEEDRKAPDYARTVDIHRKPGYDPVELFLDPKLRSPKLKMGFKKLRSLLGFRSLYDVIPLDASLVKGSHGRVPEDRRDRPVLIGDFPALTDGSDISATGVFEQLFHLCSREG